MTKTCRYACGQTKPVEEFGPHKLTPDGLNTYCRQCEADRLQIRKHGITRAQKNEIAQAQGGCAICKHPDPGGKGWVVDHDHACCPGEKSCPQCRRGVLCQWCNNVLGYAFDRPQILRAAAAYLESGDRLDTDRSSDSVDRAGVADRVSGPTDVRDVRTHADSPSPTSETSRFVTRTRTYGFEVDR